MTRIVVAGGGVCGLAAAMLLARDGHDVTVLERDPAPPPPTPADAWELWARRGVAQFRQIHYLLPRVRQLLEAELPDVAAALGAVALRHHPLADVATDRREDDHELVALTARRPVAEAAVAGVADRTVGITVRRGVGVRAVRTGAEALPGVPHVTGVVTDAGEELLADLVVDASGRRSPLPRWLHDAGARPCHEEHEDSGFVYFSRHFRSTSDELPATLGPLLQHFGSLSVLTLPADRGTWGVGLIASAGDRALLPLRDPERWTAVATALTPIAHWVDGAPITGVQVLNRLEDRRRRLVVGGQPVATGIVAVADACASTNPTLGRGIPLGLMHAVCLRDLLREGGLDDPGGFALAWDDTTETHLTSAYRAVVVADRHRLGEINAHNQDAEYRTDDLAWQAYRALETVAHHDPELLRGWFRIAGLLASGAEVFSAPGLLARLGSVLAAHPIDQAEPVVSRARLLEIVAG